MARRFSASQRVALYLMARGQCSNCGASLEPGWHGDHVIPFCQVHVTDVSNGQALCPRCNLTKGSKLMTEQPLFRWQAAAQANYFARLPKDYLLVAVPGAGKTFWAMHTARELLKAGRIERILIVAPTKHVKGQWARTAHRVGLNIEPDYRNSDGAWPLDAEGVSMTYSQMFEQSALHRRNVSLRPTLVILDEVHHLQENAGWGRAAAEAFDMAAYRIHLSGTPWNKEGYIPWVTYDSEGKAQADDNYSYMDSLTDGVNCDVFFPKSGARCEWEWDGEIFSRTFEDKVNERDRARRLSTALAVPESNFIATTFQQADSELSQIRALPRQDRAGGLVIAKDITHAEAIADLIADLNKPRPPVISSENTNSARLLKNFSSASCTDRWLVSVRMVSEGVDIPRLRVLLYATNVTTRLFFRQAVGRVTRGPEPPAVVYLPADPILLQYAREIRDERLEALRITEKNTDSDEPRDSKPFQPLRGEAFADGVIHADGPVTQTELDFARHEIEAQGGRPTVELVTITAKILRQHAPGPESATQQPPDPDAPIQSERKEALKQAMKKLISGYCYRTGQEHAKVNAELNEAVGVTRVRDCTEEQLRRRYELAKERCS